MAAGSLAQQAHLDDWRLQQAQSALGFQRAQGESFSVAADGASGAVLQDHIHSTPAENGAENHIESSQIYRRCRHDGCSEWNRPVFRPKEAETCLEVRVSRVLGFKHNRLHK